MSSNRNMVYSVVIMRTDGQHIDLTPTADYDKCYVMWKQLSDEWKDAAKEQRPFILTDPLVTAFAPALIYEIRLFPVSTQEMASNTHNPYNKKMQEEGFGRTFPGQGHDLLSRG